MSRDYARVASTFWTRGSGKALRGDADAQLVALYLMSCPAGNMVGLFHLALVTLCAEVGISAVRAQKALARLAALGIAHHDAEEEIVWVPMAPAYQLGQDRLSAADKRILAIRRIADTFEGHGFHALFLDMWAERLCLPRQGESWGAKLRGRPTMPDAPSAIVPTMPDAPSMPLPENGHDPGVSGAVSGAVDHARCDPAAPAAPQDVTPLSAFVGSVWPDARTIPEPAWREAYPAIDLLAEARSAYAWEQTQPAAKRKRDHRRFLDGWFRRAQERAATSRAGPTQGSLAPSRPPAHTIWKGTET